jgi:ubiquinone/menaquinone biosynthesis C-methylase UbiE
MTENKPYPGKELELFKEAINWKNNLLRHIRPHISFPVLEVGAGIGSNTILFNNKVGSCWQLLEPDTEFAEILSEEIKQGTLPANCHLKQGTIFDLAAGSEFNCILYIDVLEHIADDQTEICRALDLLAPGGKLIILAPAFQSLYSPFDKAIGHYRRYKANDLKMLLRAASGKVVANYYLDCLGFIASICNKLLLRQGYPGVRQLKFWDRVLVPVSAKIDPLFRRYFGKSLLFIWQKD